MSLPQPNFPPDPAAQPSVQPMGTHQLAPTNIVQYPIVQQVAPMPQMPTPDEQGIALRNIISIEDVIRYVKRYWKLSAMVAAVTSVLMLTLLVGRTPLYESATHLEVQIDRAGPGMINTVSPLENSATFIVNNHQLRLQTGKYHDYVYSNVDPDDKTDFLENRGFDPPIVAKAIGGFKSAISGSINFVKSLVSSDGEPGDPTEAERKAFVEKLNLAIKIDLIKESHSLRIAAKGPNRELVAKLANQYASLYVDYLSHEERTAAESAFDFLSQQEERYRELTQASTQELNKFRLEHEILGNGDASDPMHEQLKLIYAARGNERIALTQAETVLLQVERLRENGQSLINIQEIERNPSVQELKKAYDARQQDYSAQLALLGGESHIKVREARSRAEAAQQQLLIEIDRTAEGFANIKAASKQKLESLDEQLRAVEREVVDQGEKGIQLANLVARAESDKKTYEQILAKQNEARFEMEKFLSPDVKVIDNAVVPKEPYRPNKPLSVIMAGFVFCAMFVGLPLGLGLGNDMTRRFGVRLPFLHRNLPAELGVVPMVAGSSTMHMLADAFSPGATREALFKLAKNLDRRARPGGGGRTILVTSAEENEGKSFVAAAMGGAYCSQGRRTLVIDCNLHSPSMNIWFPQFKWASQPS